MARYQPGDLDTDGHTEYDEDERIVHKAITGQSDAPLFRTDSPIKGEFWLVSNGRGVDYKYGTTHGADSDDPTQLPDWT